MFVKSFTPTSARHIYIFDVSFVYKKSLSERIILLLKVDYVIKEEEGCVRRFICQLVALLCVDVCSGIEIKCSQKKFM